jgi:glycosyltransferase involved in cell wall biosynthesis
MKIAFFSNFMSHHQLPLCLSLKKYSSSFHFIASRPIPDKKLKIGYDDMNNADFVIRAYENTAEAQIHALLFDSDIVIFGDGSEKYLPLRMAESKLSFLYTERFLKKGFWQRFRPTTRRRIKNKTSKYNGLPYHILCAGGYVAADARYFNFQNSLYRWAYFPPVEKIDIEALLAKKRSLTPLRLIWVGRFLPWKRPEIVIYLAANLNKRGLKFQLEMIGSGKMEARVRDLIRKNELQEFVTLTGVISADKVRERMREASIFILSSDFHEGWGAVLNEAMGNGCCCISSSAAGSASTLISHENNGMVYNYKDIHELTSLCEKVLCDTVLRERLGRNAYQTIVDCWNAEFAAKRFINLAECLMDKKPYDAPASGPCSLA